MFQSLHCIGYIQWANETHVKSRLGRGISLHEQIISDVYTFMKEEADKKDVYNFNNTCLGETAKAIIDITARIKSEREN